MLRVRAVTIVAAAVLASLPGCDRSRATAERAVRAYDEEVIRAFRTGDTSRLGEVALRKEADRVLVLVDLKKADRLVLESEMPSFDVTSVVKSEGTLTVETHERWRYHDRPLDPGRTAGPVFVADMRMRYRLGQEKGAWKVRDVETISNEYLEQSGARRP